MSDIITLQLQWEYQGAPQRRYLNSSENNNFFFKNQNFISLFKQLKAVNAVYVQPIRKI